MNCRQLLLLISITLTGCWGPTRECDEITDADFALTREAYSGAGFVEGDGGCSVPDVVWPPADGRKHICISFEGTDTVAVWDTKQTIQSPFGDVYQYLTIVSGGEVRGVYCHTGYTFRGFWLKPGELVVEVWKGEGAEEEAMRGATVQLGP